MSKGGGDGDAGGGDDNGWAAASAVGRSVSWSVPVVDPDASASASSSVLASVSASASASGRSVSFRDGVDDRMRTTAMNRSDEGAGEEKEEAEEEEEGGTYMNHGSQSGGRGATEVLLAEIAELDVAGRGRISLVELEAFLERRSSATSASLRASLQGAAEAAAAVAAAEVGMGGTPPATPNDSISPRKQRVSSDGTEPDLWFTQEEVDEFKSSTKGRALVVQHHILRGRIPSADHVLGLEKFLTPVLEEEYRVRRRRAVASVLSKAPAALEENDLRSLARASALSTQWARRQARAAGLFLEQDVEAEREAQSRRSLDCFADAKVFPVKDGRAVDMQVCVPR
ncbi:hypothetical protein ACHAWF_018340 [Thalassiosira exigua]